MYVILSKKIKKNNTLYVRKTREGLKEYNCMYENQTNTRKQNGFVGSKFNITFVSIISFFIL